MTVTSSDPPQPPPVDDFHPPYHLGAFGCALVGVWKDPPDVLDGFKPLRWFGGGYLGVALVLRYDKPPDDYPAPYSEVILSYAMRKRGVGSGFAAVPFDLILDNPFYVEAGLKHYHLPKRLDPTLRIELEEKRISCVGRDIAIDAALGSVIVPGAKCIVSTLLEAFTSRVPIVGTSSQPFLRTLITVSPKSSTMSRARKTQTRVEVGGRSLRPLAGFFWRSLAITVGVPATLL